MDITPPATRWPQTRHGTGDDGFYFYEYGCDGGYARVSRLNRASSEKISYYHVLLPDRAFPSFAAMSRAAAEMDAPAEAAARAQAAKYPLLQEVKQLDASDGRKCRCCGAPATTRITLATSWVQAHSVLVSLCDDHAGFMLDPAGLLAALTKPRT